MFSQPNYPSSIIRLHEKEVFIIFFSGAPPDPPFGNWPDHICIASSGPALLIEAAWDCRMTPYMHSVATSDASMGCNQAGGKCKANCTYVHHK